VSEVTGDFAEAERHLNLVLALERRGNAEYVANFGVDPVIGSEWIKARLLWMKGFPDQARKQVRVTLQRIEREEMDLRSACYSLVIACNVHQYCGDVAEVLALAARGAQFCQKHGFEAELHWFEFFEGWALFSSGDSLGDDAGGLSGNPSDGLSHGLSDGISHGISQMRAGMEFLAASGVRLFASPYAAIFADAAIRQGEWQEASRWIAWALEFGSRSGYRYAEPELYRLKAECEAAEGNPAEAEAGFERAMALSREQGARSLELRIAMSLARFWQAHGKSGDGQRLVSEIYGEFIEGLETADLAAARELLASLETRASGIASGIDISAQAL
jgi:tetratricopeptide (TPR) repeat protein